MTSVEWDPKKYQEEPSAYNEEEVRETYRLGKCAILNILTGIGLYYDRSHPMIFRSRLRQILPTAFMGYKTNDELGLCEPICEAREDDPFYGRWREFKTTLGSRCPVENHIYGQVLFQYGGRVEQGLLSEYEWNFRLYTDFTHPIIAYRVALQNQSPSQRNETCAISAC